eukprot:scaffold250610_cov30-Tisochrysis_lutea.AAC.9
MSDASATMKGSRISPVLFTTSRVESCNAPSRSAGWIRVPSRRVRLRIVANATPISLEHHVACRGLNCGPYSRPTVRRAVYKSLDRIACALVSSRIVLATTPLMVPVRVDASPAQCDTLS